MSKVTGWWSDGSSVEVVRVQGEDRIATWTRQFFKDGAVYVVREPADKGPLTI